ncbi:MAG: hypothetical protein NC084_10075 [Bacteroides sp.]|nr:hypothetical protein [Eubacterium sp.]MCM1419187.1 hypothetical protein [Roseburia sp.]MCM1463046.1 hypothetical protein [Bacteroides sp.]
MKELRPSRVVLYALMAAILFVAQVSLAFLPNIELVTLLIIVFTLFTGKKVFYIIYAFVLLEGAVYGFGLWWVSYLYIWLIPAGAALLMKKLKNPLGWAVFAGAYGLCYGALCGIPYLFIGGFSAFFAYWVSGIPFDVTHCIGNFIVTLLLFKPLCAAMRLAEKYMG